MARLVWTLPDGESTARWATDEGGGSIPEDSLPTATLDPTGAGVVVDDTTYDDPYLNDGTKMRTLVFPAAYAGASLGLALEGDDFPRVVMSADGAYPLNWGDGTFDPYAQGAMTTWWPSDDGGAVAGIGGFGNRYFYAPTKLGTHRAPVAWIQGGGLALGSAGEGAPVAAVFSGATDPNDDVGGEVDDMYVMTGSAPGEWLWRCTVAGAAGDATWVAML